MLIVPVLVFSVFMKLPEGFRGRGGMGSGRKGGEKRAYPVRFYDGGGGEREGFGLVKKEFI